MVLSIIWLLGALALVSTSLWLMIRRERHKRRRKEGKGGYCSPLHEMGNPHIALAMTAMAVLADGKRPGDEMMERIERDVLSALGLENPRGLLVAANGMYEDMDCDKLAVIDDAVAMLAKKLDSDQVARLTDRLEWVLNSVEANDSSFFYLTRLRNGFRRHSR